MRPLAANASVVAAIAVAAVVAAAATVVVVAPARAAESVADLRTRLDAAVGAGLAPEAQAAGRKILAEFPDDPAALHVLRVFHENGWKWPRLRTSFATLYRWTNDAIDDASEPELRLAVVETIEDLHPREDYVRDGGSLYVRQWCHMRARHWDESIRLGKDFLRRFGDSSMVDKCRWSLALALLGKSPPDVEAARRHLEWLAEDPKRRNSANAKRRLDALRVGLAWIDVEDGCPRAAGLGKVAVVTDLKEHDPLWKSLDAWRAARSATVIRLRDGDPATAEAKLRKLGPEFVAFAVAPGTLDANFHWRVLDLCRGLDDDPMPDFHFGYLTARDTRDLRDLAARALAPRQGESRFAIASTGASQLELTQLDGFLHFGHGSATRVVSGWDAATAAAIPLTRAPLVVSGACFNGVTSRSYEPCTMQPVVLRPVEHAPHDVISLAWVHAGAVGVIAALEADRGEMAAHEWSHIRETACTLGEAAGLQARLACTSLPESVGFPRYSVGGARSLLLFDVMLRGATSRVLIGDPTVRMLTRPALPASVAARASYDAATKSWSATIEVPAQMDWNESQFAFINTLTVAGMGEQGFSERRLWARVEVPAEVRDAPAAPAIRVEHAGVAVPTLRTFVRHEVWGGRRYVVLQAESADITLSKRGTTLTADFPAR